LAFCPNCGKEVSPDALACPNCGHPLKQIQPAAKPAEHISAWWWLLPFFLTWIGGLIAYFVLKDRNSKTATNMLIFGIIWAFVGVIITVLFLGFLFGLTGVMG
jgi:uncharacterized membrane protein YvbJ